MWDFFLNITINIIGKFFQVKHKNIDKAGSKAEIMSWLIDKLINRKLACKNFDEKYIL